MYKILLVDDEILVRDAIRENIDWKSLDCELVGDCENGRQAVEFVQSHKVDVVLTDICQYNIHFVALHKFHCLSAILTIPHKLTVQAFPVNVLPDCIPDQDFVVYQ